MKMKYIVNGTEYPLEILYGTSVIFHYESIVKLAGVNKELNPSCTYRFGKEQGILMPGKRIEIPNTETPIFNVAVTGAA